MPRARRDNSIFRPLKAASWRRPSMLTSVTSGRGCACFWGGATQRSDRWIDLRPLLRLLPPEFGRTRGEYTGRPAGVRDRAGLRGPQRPLRAAARSVLVVLGVSYRQGARTAPRGGQINVERLEPSLLELMRYHKIACDEAVIQALLVTLFLQADQRPPKQIILDLDATDDPLHGHQQGRFSTAITIPTAICRLRVLRAAPACCQRVTPTSMQPRAASRRSSGSSGRSAPIWPRVRLRPRADSGLPARG